MPDCSVCLQLCFLIISLSFGFNTAFDDDSMEESPPFMSPRTSTQILHRPTSLSIDHCPIEYVSNDSRTLSWNETPAGRTGTTNRLCLQPNGLPLTRKCVRRVNQPPIWEALRHKITDCVTQTREKLITDTLIQLEEEAFVTRKLQPRETARRLKQLLRSADFKIIPTDIYLASKIVNRATAGSGTPELCLELLSINDRLMGVGRDVLRASALLNSTNDLLAAFERCVDETSGQRSSAAVPPEDRIEGISFSEMGVQAHLAQNLSVFYVNPEISNVSGVALYENPPSTQGMFRATFSKHFYRFLYFNDTLDSLFLEQGLRMATFVPFSLWQNLTATLPSPALFIIKFYSNDALFMESRLNTTREVFSKIASLTIPGVSGSFPELLPMIFYNQHGVSPHQHPQTGCGYWTYDTWLSNGMELIRDDSGNSNLIACGSHHMTQFAYLIGGDYRHNDFSDNVVVTRVHLRALNIITLVGCTLSILGLLGIFITALVFKSWRSKASSKVLLHLCTAILFQMILFCFVNTHDMTVYLMQNRDYAGCVAMGALLQYSVLVEFAWMLIIAFFQFQRYVQVFGSRPKRFVLKSAIVGWGLPIISPVITVAVGSRSYIPYYNKDSSMMCYPSGNAMNFGVILPIATIIAANLVIFVMVLWNIRHTMEAASKRSEKRAILQQIRLMVMMFFLFGLSWIFGLLAAVDAGLAFSYLFCITATLQGFVLFVYFVILDPVTRKSWYQLCWNAESKLKTSETTRLGTTSSSYRDPQ